MKNKTNISEIENALLMHDSVIECVVILRKNKIGKQHLIAYVVISGDFSSEQLDTHLKRLLPDKRLPSVYVHISALPLTAKGFVDFSVIENLYVIEPSLIKEWEGTIERFSNVKHIAVVSRQKKIKNAVLHIDDIAIKESGIISKTTQSDFRVSNQSNYFDVHKETKPAYSDGGNLIIPDNSPKTFTEAFLNTVKTNGKNGIHYIRAYDKEEFQTYNDLFNNAKCILGGLTKNGLLPGNSVILQIKKLDDYFQAFWACILGGIVPVTVAVPHTYIEKNAIVNKLYSIWKLLDKPPILSGEDLIGSIAGLEKVVGMNGVKIFSIERLKFGTPNTEIYKSKSDDIAFYQLTSGSTGVPKCIQEKHESIICHIHASQQVNNYCSDDISLNWLPMDHVVPILTYHLKDVYLGCNQIEVPTQLILSNPLFWLSLIDKYKVTHTWAPNFGFKLVNKALAEVKGKKWDLSSVKFLMNAGEQVTLPVVKEFLNLTAPFGINESVMQPAFGMAEVCTCMTYQNNFSLSKGIHYIEKDSLSNKLRFVDTSCKNTISFVDLGGPVHGVEIRIADENNKVLPEGIIGRLHIRGNVVTTGYLNNKKANDEAFVGGGWFNSGDLGFIRDGRLTLTGREKEMIIIYGANFYCYEIEDIVSNIEGVESTFVAACGITDSNSGSEVVAIFFTPTNAEISSNIELIKNIRLKIIENLGINPSYIIPVLKNDFPKTTSGKIQRGLLKHSLLNGDFKSTLKEIDICLENINTIPDWFFEKYWVPKNIIHSKKNKFVESIVIISDSSGLGKCFYKELIKDQRKVIYVEIGKMYQEVNSCYYVISSNIYKHFDLLINSFIKNDIHISSILYLLPYDHIADVDSIDALIETQNVSIVSILHLIKALDKNRSALGVTEVRLMVVSSFARLIGEQDKVEYTKATLPGFVNAIDHEFFWIKCRYIDFTRESLNDNAKYLIQELYDNSKDIEVAYRSGKRLIPILKKIDISKENSKSICPFKKGGLYLITGALGGIGLKISRYLLEHYKAKLLLVGTTELPTERHQAELNDQDAKLSERILAYQSLTKFNDSIFYISADVCEFDDMQEAVFKAEKKWDSLLDGVIHLAGIFQERMLSDETPEHLFEVIRPKVLGSWILNKIMEKRQQGLFVTFSSINSFFGGMGIAAYSAANSFIETFSAYQNLFTSLQTYCLSWSMWEEVGMSKGYALKNLLASKGYNIINEQKGLNCFLLALSRNYQELIIGLNGMHKNIQRFMPNACINLQEINGYYTLKEDYYPEYFEHLMIYDSFDVPTTCEFIHLDQMPLSETGLVDKQKLLIQESKLKQGDFNKQPLNKLEQLFLDIWKDVFNTNLIKVEDSFIEKGGDSLSALKLASRVYSSLKIELSVSEIFKHPTISKLACYVQNKLEDKSIVVDNDNYDLLRYLKNKKDKPDSIFPLSFSQEALWRHEQLFPEIWIYNMPYELHIQGELDINALNYAFQELINRHEALRTVFGEENGIPYQRIVDDFPVNIKIEDIKCLNKKNINQLIQKEERTKFNLNRGPLLRVRVLRLNEKEFLMFLTIHHIIFDGWSYGVIFNDLSTYYNNFKSNIFCPLKPLPVARYVDFIQWQRNFVNSKTMHNQLEYWKKKLSHLDLHAIFPDLSCKSSQDHNGHYFPIILDKDSTQKIKNLCSKYKISLFTVLISIFDLFVYSYTNHEDVAIGTIVATRKFQELENLVGFFINALVIRSDLSGNPNFKEILSRNKKVTLEAFENQDLPFGNLIEAMQSKQKENKNNSFYQVMFVLQNTGAQRLNLNDLIIKKYRKGYNISRADLILELQEDNHRLYGGYYYNGDIFKSSTIGIFNRCFQSLVKLLVNNPGIRLKSLVNKVKKEIPRRKN